MSSLRAKVICQKYFGNHVILSQIYLFCKFTWHEALNSAIDAGFTAHWLTIYVACVSFGSSVRLSKWVTIGQIQTHTHTYMYGRTNRRRTQWSLGCWTPLGKDVRQESLRIPIKVTLREATVGVQKELFSHLHWMEKNDIVDIFLIDRFVILLVFQGKAANIWLTFWSLNGRILLDMIIIRVVRRQRRSPGGNHY